MSEIRTATLSNLAGTGPATLTGQSAAKVWNIYTYASGVPVIQNSFNVSSVTDVLAGRTNSNLTAAMVSVNYPSYSENNDTGGNPTTSLFTSASQLQADTNAADNRASVLAHGDLA